MNQNKQEQQTTASAPRTKNRPGFYTTFITMIAAILFAVIVSLSIHGKNAIDEAFRLGQNNVIHTSDSVKHAELKNVSDSFAVLLYKRDSTITSLVSKRNVIPKKTVVPLVQDWHLGGENDGKPVTANEKSQELDPSKVTKN